MCCAAVSGSSRLPDPSTCSSQASYIPKLSELQDLRNTELLQVPTAGRFAAYIGVPGHMVILTFSMHLVVLPYLEDRMYFFSLHQTSTLFHDVSLMGLLLFLLHCSPISLPRQKALVKLPQ